MVWLATELSKAEDPAEQAELAKEAATGRLKRDELKERTSTPRKSRGGRQDEEDHVPRFPHLGRAENHGRAKAWPGRSHGHGRSRGGCPPVAQRARYRRPGCGLSSPTTPELCPDYRHIIINWARPVEQACRPPSSNLVYKGPAAFTDLEIGCSQDGRRPGRRSSKGPVNRAARQGEDYLTYEVSAVSRMTQTR